jgi:hypothetical protein
MYILLIYIITLKGLSVSHYKQVFGPDYEKAIQYNIKKKHLYYQYAQKYSVDVDELKTIVFPELIRYSYFKDLMETKALEQMYVQGGSKLADFSIGHFQMKPSFVEELEASVSSNTWLKQKYACVVNYGSGSDFLSQRLERLKNEQWQFVFLCCFIDVADTKYPSLKLMNKEKRMRFLCAAYNTGISHTEEKINSLMNEKFFPYGPKYKASQYAYADVALDYYKNYLNK